MLASCSLDKIPERNEVKVTEDLLQLMDRNHMDPLVIALGGGRMSWQGGSLCW